jgi:hypothetical protein
VALSTKSIINKESEIDTTWAFEFYLNLPFKLTGGDHKVKSPFSVDKDPSFAIYKLKTDPNGPYRWNDLSTGNKGSILDLVGRLRAPDPNNPLSKLEALEIVRKDFHKCLNDKSYVPEASKALLNTKGRVTDWELRKWNAEDLKWWESYGVCKTTLEKYNVAPMYMWKMHKIVDGVEKNMEFNNPKAYGYLTQKGELAKIYQPGIKGAKFVKVKEYYLQGSDQWEHKNDQLIIIS